MIIIRLANNTDAFKIFEWRNDYLTRKMYLETKIITKENHMKWFQGVLKNVNIFLLICLYKNQKIGLVRFDINKIKAGVSINICRTRRGMGLGKVCLDKSINYLIENYPKIKFLRAKIKYNNVASKKIFEKNGFKFLLKKENIIFYQKIL